MGYVNTNWGCTYDVLFIINLYEHKTMLVINYYCLFKILNSCLKTEKKRLDDNRECGNCKEANKKGKKKG